MTLRFDRIVVQLDVNTKSREQLAPTTNAQLALDGALDSCHPKERPCVPLLLLAERAHLDLAEDEDSREPSASLGIAAAVCGGSIAVLQRIFADKMGQSRFDMQVR